MTISESELPDDVSESAPFPLLSHRDRARGDFVRGLGLVADGFATIQIDLNPVRRSVKGVSQEITLCDHNCTTTVNGVPTGGHYDCPAAISLNRGVGRGDLAPTDALLTGLRSTVNGLRESQRTFLAHDLGGYLDEQRVPAELRQEFQDALANQRVIVNLFGGSPELHPGVLDIIEQLHQQNVDVHLTTTGSRVLRDAAFRADFLRRPPDVLGLGADDFDSVDAIDELFESDFDDLSAAWRRVPWTHGQRRKALEAVQLCKLAEREPMPSILFNIVLHAGNLGCAEDLLDSLGRHVPAAILNPYPAQTAFLGERGGLGPQDLRRLGRIARSALRSHADRLLGRRPRWNLAPRVGYWLLMLSLIEGGTSDELTADRVGGDGVWKCYTRRGAGRCVQVGVGTAGATAHGHPGGHLGCFWNTSTITDDRQVWALEDAQVADWVLEGRQRTASRTSNPCRGCLFPRMSMDAVSLELGLQPDVADRYWEVRRHYVGY